MRFLRAAQIGFYESDSKVWGEKSFFFFLSLTWVKGFYSQKTQLVLYAADQEIKFVSYETMEKSFSTQWCLAHSASP